MTKAATTIKRLIRSWNMATAVLRSFRHPERSAVDDTATHMALTRVAVSDGSLLIERPTLASGLQIQPEPQSNETTRNRPMQRGKRTEKPPPKVESGYHSTKPKESAKIDSKHHAGDGGEGIEEMQLQRGKDICSAAADNHSPPIAGGPYALHVCPRPCFP